MIVSSTMKDNICIMEYSNKLLLLLRVPYNLNLYCNPGFESSVDTIKAKRIDFDTKQNIDSSLEDVFPLRRMSILLK